MKSQLREAGSRQIAFVEAWANPCPELVPLRESTTEVPPNPDYKSPWKIILGQSGLRLNAFQPGNGSWKAIQSP
jgi:hypothetical protein